MLHLIDSISIEHFNPNHDSHSLTFNEMQTDELKFLLENNKFASCINNFDLCATLSHITGTLIPCCTVEYVFNIDDKYILIKRLKNGILKFHQIFCFSAQIPLHRKFHLPKNDTIISESDINKQTEKGTQHGHEY